MQVVGIPKTSNCHAQEGGFAAIDALVALLILSATLVLALGDLQTSARLSRTAEQTSQAIALARGLMARGPEPDTGSSGDLSWSIDLHPVASANGETPGVCARDLVVRSRTDRRVYRFTDAVACS